MEKKKTQKKWLGKKVGRNGRSAHVSRRGIFEGGDYWWHGGAAA